MDEGFRRVLLPLLRHHLQLSRRPQTIKKVIQLASSCGCTSLEFVNADNVVPSYLQSKSLRPDSLERECRLACEQVGDCIFPSIVVGERILEVAKLKRSQGSCFFGDTQPNAFGLKQIKNVPAVIAIGPETGWSSREREGLLELGFQGVSLGERIYRVETATSLILGYLTAQMLDCESV